MKPTVPRPKPSFRELLQQKPGWWVPRIDYEPRHSLETKLSIYERITIDEAKERLRSERQPPWNELDPYILPIVEVLYKEGVETYQSCQGGPGHPFPQPTVQFYGTRAEGFRALSIALQYGLDPTALRRVYTITDGEAVGPDWELTFRIDDCPSWDYTPPRLQQSD